MKRTITLCALLGIVSLAGCSGGGSSAGSGTRATILLTDSPREDYAHVWATIFHVELAPQDGSAAVTVFDNPAGVQIDLKTLRDAAGARYAFLSSANVPAGTYTGANVTVGPTMQLLKNGAAVGDPLPIDSSIARDASGNAVIPVTFKTAKTLGAGATNIILDFNLARFVIRNSKVLPALSEGDGVGLHDPRRHEDGDYQGRVSNLAGSAPTLTFTLTLGNGQTVAVATTAATALYGASLANGGIVRVEGTLDTTTQTLVATSVGVCGAGGPPVDVRAPRAAGTASALDAAAGTFTLTLKRAHGFTASQTTITIATSATTLYRDDSGATVTAAAFFTTLATTPNVHVAGTFDAATNTLTATDLRAFDPTKNGGWAREHHGFRDGRGDRWGNGAWRGAPG